jgi:hypothetical protein
MRVENVLLGVLSRGPLRLSSVAILNRRPRFASQSCLEAALSAERIFMQVRDFAV